MMSDPLFISTIAALATITIARSVRGASRGRTASRLQVAPLTEQLDQHEAALENVEASMERQLSQLSELQERLDFAERLLFQYRDHGTLEPGEPHR